MAFFRSLCMAFSCFSRIPMPRVEWDDSSLRYMLCFFPLIGLVVSLVWWLWSLLCTSAGFNSIVFATGMTVVPLVVTGGIHMDGFADVVDAQSSHADSEKKRQILKDPHAGAFAIIGVCAYMLLYFALFTEVDCCSLPPALLVVPFLVRSLSGFATTAFPKSSSVGMLSAFQESADKRAVLAVLGAFIAACAVVLVLLSHVAGGIVFAAALACLVLFYAFETTQFGGMSGDLAGFFLQVTELVLLAVIVVCAKTAGL